MNGTNRYLHKKYNRIREPEYLRYLKSFFNLKLLVWNFTSLTSNLPMYASQIVHPHFQNPIFVPHRHISQITPSSLPGPGVLHSGASSSDQIEFKTHMLYLKVTHKPNEHIVSFVQINYLSVDLQLFPFLSCRKKSVYKNIKNRRKCRSMTLRQINN